MMQADDLTTALSGDEFHLLDEFLASLEHDDAILDISEFDGFITAVVSGPDMIMPSQWLPVVWGGEENAPEWGSMEEYQRVFELMIRHLNTTSAMLMQEPAEYDPCFLEREVEGVTHWIVDEWCAGYMKGVALYPGQSEDSPDLEDLLTPIWRFADEDGWDSLEGLSGSEIRRLQEQIAPAALALHRYWLQQRGPVSVQSTSYIRPAPKVGRNDPCPCGSGRKYKKCCGTH